MATAGAAIAAFAHGASRGLHLHLSPDPAKPGATITVELEAEEPVSSVRLGFSGHEPKVRQLDPAKKRFSMKLEVPAKTADTVNCHAEVKTAAGKTFRASAVLRVAAPRPESR